MAHWKMTSSTMSTLVLTKLPTPCMLKVSTTCSHQLHLEDGLNTLAHSLIL